MFAVTLLTNPASPALDRALVDALRNAWGGGDAIWLAPDEACEFLVPTVPDTAEAAWSDLQAQGVDLIVQPSEGRRKKLMLADMDSTMIGQECIDELAAEAGIGARVAEITARAMNGELDFEGALKERVGLLKGLPENVIAKVWEERIAYAPGARELIATLNRDGIYTALVSGGFVPFTARVAEGLGFREHRANTLHIEDGVLTGTVAEPILGRDAKVQTLRELCGTLGIETGEAMAVGDGANDLGMLQMAGAGVALHAKPSVAAQAKIRVNHGDLTALLFMQGYARSDFA